MSEQNISSRISSSIEKSTAKEQAKLEQKRIKTTKRIASRVVKNANKGNLSFRTEGRFRNFLAEDSVSPRLELVDENKLRDTLSEHGLKIGYENSNYYFGDWINIAEMPDEVRDLADSKKQASQEKIERKTSVVTQRLGNYVLKQALKGNTHFAARAPIGILPIRPNSQYVDQNILSENLKPFGIDAEFNLTGVSVYDNQNNADITVRPLDKDVPSK